MKTVLIVDPALGNSLEGFEPRAGYVHIVVQDARTALDLLQREPTFDLLITDLSLPDRDGLDFVAELRQTWPDLPVIVTSAQGSIESYLRAASLGVCEYLNRPVLHSELSHIIGLLLDREHTGTLPPEAA